MISSPDAAEFRCFVGGLSWNTTDRGLEDAFRPYSSVVDAKVMMNKDTGRSRGFGFVTFGDESSMEEAIYQLHGKELDGRIITVNRAQPKSRQGADRYRKGGDECFRCGQSGHWARECPSNERGGAGSSLRYSRGGGDRYASGSKSGRYVDDHKDESSYGNSRYTGSDRYRHSGKYSDGDSLRSSSSYHGDGYGGRSDRYSSGGGQSRRDRSGPYDRPR